MSFTTIIEQRHLVGGRVIIPSSPSSSNVIVSIDEEVGTGGGSQVFPLIIDVSRVISFYVVVAIDAELQAAGPINFDLKANVPYIWIAAAPYEAFKYNVDLTQLSLAKHANLINRIQIRMSLSNTA